MLAEWLSVGLTVVRASYGTHVGTQYSGGVHGLQFSRQISREHSRHRQGVRASGRQGGRRRQAAGSLADWIDWLTGSSRRTDHKGFDLNC